MNENPDKHAAAELAKAIREVIDRTAQQVGNPNRHVLQNPANGKTRIAPHDSDCEDGMYALRWRVP